MQGWFIPFPCVPITFPSKSLWPPESFKPAWNQNGLYLKGFSLEAGIRIHTCIHIIQSAQLVWGWWKNGDDFQIFNVCFSVSLFLLCCLPSFQIGNLEWTEMHILIPYYEPHICLHFMSRKWLVTEQTHSYIDLLKNKKKSSLLVLLSAGTWRWYYEMRKFLWSQPFLEKELPESLCLLCRVWSCWELEFF